MIAQLALAVSLTAPPDHWFGSDKLKHFFIAAFTQTVAYSAFQAARVHHNEALVGAWAVTATVSIAKEVHDRRSYGLFSYRDLVWDAAGAGVATLVISKTVRTPSDAAPSNASRFMPKVGPLLSRVAPGPILAQQVLFNPAPRR
ncbi:MAG TPA: hypothetical protein VL308_00945 [Gemmatimonadaceae bacterium]|jgi:putative lipoprotein|nr:hypothetical protein [Gemmatimonadaceae bacterium]